MSLVKKLAASAALATALMASPLLVSTSSAATLTITGGTAGVLGLNFNPTNAASMLLDLVGPGKAITYFDSSTTSADGLFVSPQIVTLTFQFKGYEAGNTSVSAAEFTYLGTPMFTNKTTPGGTTSLGSFNVLADPGLVPFLFKNLDTGRTAVNGGPVSAGSRLAFAQINANTVYALFDDGGAGPDSDYDDMVVKITATGGGTDLATPIPGALPLFASGLGLIGFVARRRKQKSSGVKPV